MAFPAVQKYLAAGMLLNQQITFVSLLTTLGTYITGITNQAIAKGMTCAGSSNGVTAAMDGVNRCTTAAGFAVQAANTTTAQSWIVINHANGAQTCFANVGASNDIARVSCSPGGLFVAAGTATFTPTATDEIVSLSGTSLIGSTASGNRVFNVLIDSAHNGWRSFIFRSSIVAGPYMGVELYDPAFVAAPAVVNVSTWAFCQAAASLSTLANVGGGFSANNIGGLCRMTVSGVGTTVNLGGSFKILGNSASAQGNVAQELNGNVIPNRIIGLSSNQAAGHGDVGNRYDWHWCDDFQPCGALDPSKLWIMLNLATVTGSTGGLLCPWDGVTASQTA